MRLTLAAVDRLTSEPDAAALVERLRPWRLVILAVVAGLVLLGVIGGAHRYPPRLRPPANDHAVYEQVIDEVAAGRPYDPSAVAAQRRAGYPLRPFVTVRLPTLALAMAALPDRTMRRWAVRVLASAAVGAWVWRLRTLVRRPVGFTLAVLLLVGSALPAFSDYGYSLHEVWAGELIALCLAFWRPGGWGLSFLFCLLATLVRELAAPVALVMGLMAASERRWGEALAWVGALLGLGAVLGVHAAALAPLVRPGDPGSPGWLAIGGWPFLLSTLQWNGAMLLAPGRLVGLIAPVALLGCLAAPGPTGRRLAMIVVGYAAGFLAVGRPDNAYWGLLIAPLWPLGFAFAGPTLRALLVSRSDTAAWARPPGPAAEG